jgi:hypothetical protein
MNTVVTISKLKVSLVRIWMFLVVAGLSVEIWKYVFHLPKVELVYFLGLSYEKNLPTWYVSCLLLICALQLVFIASVKRKAMAPYVWHWWFLAAAFFYISLDETSTLHEHASSWFDFDGVLHFGWVIPAGIVVTIIGLSYIKFLTHLPRTTRWRFVTAGAVYVGGALGVELLLGYWTDMAGTHNIVYGLIDLIEEGMEILGVTLFLIALADYIASQTGRLWITLCGAEESLFHDDATLASAPVESLHASSFSPEQHCNEVASACGNAACPNTEEVVCGSCEV